MITLKAFRLQRILTIFYGTKKPVNRKEYWRNIINVSILCFGASLITIAPLHLMRQKIQNAHFQKTLDEHRKTFKGIEGSSFDNGKFGYLVSTTAALTVPPIAMTLNYIIDWLEIVLIVMFALLIRRTFIERLQDAEVLYAPFFGNAAVAFIIIAQFFISEAASFGTSMLLLVIAGVLPTFGKSKTNLKVETDDTTKIMKLHELFKSGAISENEYTMAKAKILSN